MGPGWMGSRRIIKAVRPGPAARMGLEQPRPMPGMHGSGLDLQMLGHLGHGPESSVTESPVAALESVADPQIVEPGTGKGKASAGLKAFLVQLFDDFFFDMIVQELVDALDHSRIRSSKIGCRKGKRKREGAGSPSFESEVGGDLLTPDQGDVLDEESDHPLLLPVWSPGIVPQAGEVRGELEDLFALFIAEDLLVD